MKLYIETTPATAWPAFVAPTRDGSVAGVCPQVRFRGANVAAMATGFRPWSPLIS